MAVLVNPMDFAKSLKLFSVGGFLFEVTICEFGPNAMVESSLSLPLRLAVFLVFSAPGCKTSGVPLGSLCVSKDWLANWSFCASVKGLALSAEEEAS